MEREYLNEERYQDTNKKVKKVGIILLVIGLLVIVVGMFMLFNGFGSFGKTAINSVGNGTLNNNTVQEAASQGFASVGKFALGAFINVIGFGLAAAGGTLLITAHKREIMAYQAQQVMPLAKEGIEKATPTIANAAGSIAQSISRGIEQGKNGDQ